MKLEINSRSKPRKYTNMWKVNNTLLNNQWVKEKFAREIIKYLELFEKENTTYQNVWDAEKAVLRGKFTVLNTYIKKEERSQIFHFKEWGKMKNKLNPMLAEGRKHSLKQK